MACRRKGRKERINGDLINKKYKKYEGSKRLRAEGKEACVSEVIGLVAARHGRSRPRAPTPSAAACPSPRRNYYLINSYGDSLPRLAPSAALQTYCIYMSRPQSSSIVCAERKQRQNERKDRGRKTLKYVNKERALRLSRPLPASLSLARYCVLSGSCVASRSRVRVCVHSLWRRWGRSDADTMCVQVR